MTLRIASYNIHGWVDADGESNLDRVAEVVNHHDPDIICLQEVDHPKLMFKALQSVGYSGRFLHKPDSPCVYLPNNNGPDGCAVFFKTSKFDLLGWATRILKVWDVASNQVELIEV